jgi:hypothetical protein
MSVKSSGGSESQLPIVGLVRVRDHCTFRWSVRGSTEVRTAEVDVSHCSECIEELESRGYVLRPAQPADRSRPGAAPEGP